jgi:hypothetical protein
MNAGGWLSIDAPVAARRGDDLSGIRTRTGMATQAREGLPETAERLFCADEGPSAASGVEWILSASGAGLPSPRAQEVR